MYSTDSHITPKEHKVQVAHNACYEMLFDSAKNRIYYTIQGFWKNKECVPDFINDWNKVTSLVKPGFTVLTDMQTMITHPQEMNELHKQAQTTLLSAGVGKVAYVMPKDKIAYLQVLAIHERMPLPAKFSSSLEEAEQWLDFIGTTSTN